MSKTIKYAEHYEKLEEIARASSQGLESSDIDKLIDMMGDATKHYKALEERITEVEKMLGLNQEEE